MHLNPETSSTCNRHGRDNKLHVWRTVKEPIRVLGGSASLPGLQAPELCYSMDVNALNYCRFSLLPLPEDVRTDDRHALIAVPNLVESAHVRIFARRNADVDVTAGADACRCACRQTYGRSLEYNACMRLLGKRVRNSRCLTVATCVTLLVRHASPFLLPSIYPTPC